MQSWSLSIPGKTAEDLSFWSNSSSFIQHTENYLSLKSLYFSFPYFLFEKKKKGKKNATETG